MYYLYDKPGGTEMKEKEIIRRMQSLRARLAATGEVLKGSVSPVRLGPRKHAQGQRVSYLLTYKGSDGKTKSIYVRKDRIPSVKRMIRQYKRAKQTLEDMVELNLLLFKIQPK
jgi:hypothetical protein